MKNFLCILLCTALAIPMAACGGKKANVKGLQVGFSMVKTTPENGTPMGGYGNSLERLSTSASRDLYVSCLAMTDGEDTILLFSCDLGGIEENFWNEVRPAVAKATGVAEKNILFCSTHCHSAPDLGYADSNAMAKKAFDQWVQSSVDAAKAAMEDMAPATLSAGTVETEGLTFIRHYQMMDGSYAGPNFGDFNIGVKDYAMEADNQMVLAKFDRGEDKTPILLMNFQLHPCFETAMAETIITSDCVGAVREYITTQTGMDVIYFQGSAGNQNRFSYLPQDATGDDVFSWSTKLGNYAIEALPGLAPMNGDNITIANSTYEGKVAKETDPDIIAKAKEVQAVYKESGRDIGNKKAREYGFGSVYHAGAILGHQNYPDTLTMEINAVSIGDFAFITAPYEMFSRESIAIKTGSSFAVTAIMGYAGHYNGYIPSAEAYEYGCYESQTGHFEKGTAEELAAVYIDMLNNLNK